jgi:quinol monooxygenase YgiN
LPTSRPGLVVRLAELDIDPAHLDAYTRLLREEIEASVALERGVLALHAVTLKDNPAAVRLLEIYRDQQAYEAHLQTPHFLKYKTLSATMVRSLRLIEADPLVLCAKPPA